MERFTKEELEKWWHAQCPKCGWDGLSRDCAGGEPIADTGDFNDPLCPMCIKKDDCVVVDDYVEPDAQAAIAALQVRVQELEQWVQDQSTANLEIMRHTDEMQSRAMEAEQQLTQRTAELEAAKASQAIDLKNNNAYREQVATLQAELERVRGERDHAKKMEAVQKEVADNQTWYVQKLRTLIAALPKVEGAVEVSAGDDGCYILPLWIRCVTKEQADGIAALLQERQKLC